MSISTLIGSAGVALLLIAFILNLFKLIRQDNYGYIFLNVLGAALSGYASYLINFFPFVILESTWCLVALAGLIRKWFPKPA
ncbi:MAG TPA: hypothetical protein VKR32_10770 [Puia sp.]|nr:hypothetical protein [Puia sp.]